MSNEKELFDACDAVDCSKEEACILVFQSMDIALRYRQHRNENFTQVDTGAWIALEDPESGHIAVCRDKVAVEFIDSAVKGCTYALNRLETGEIQMELFEDGGKVNPLAQEMPSDEELLLAQFRAEHKRLNEKDSAIVSECLRVVEQMLGRHGVKALLAIKIAMAGHAVFLQKIKSSVENN